MAKLRRGNQPDLDELSDQQRAAVLTGAEALKTIQDFKRRTFDEWMNVARGLAVLRQLADQRSARTAFKNLRHDHGYGSLNEATCTRLVLMAKHETAIRGWRDAQLTERQRESWNSPTSICQRCPTVRADMAKAPPRPPRKPGSRNFEMAVDTIQEALQEADEDARDAMQGRLYSAFKWTLPLENIPPKEDPIEACIEALKGMSRDEIRAAMDRIATALTESLIEKGSVTIEPEEPKPKRKRGKRKAKDDGTISISTGLKL
jgi:hypothetical protein